MGSVAEDQRSSRPPALRDGGVKAVDDGARDLVVRGVQPRRQQRADGFGAFHVLATLAVAELELPPPMASTVGGAGSRDHGHDPRGVADLLRSERQIHFTIQKKVDDQPVLIEAEILVLDAGEAPRCARRSIAAEEEAGFEASLDVALLRGDTHTLGAFLDIRQGAPERDIDGREAGRRAAQHAVENGLVVHRRRRPAVARVAAGVEAHDPLAGCVDELASRCHLHVVEERVGEVENLKAP